jgi:hypothetical protein
MNERYRYGYGEDAAGRDTPLSGGSSVTDQRDDDPVRADAEDEEARADRIREAAAESRTDTDGLSSAADGPDAAGTTDAAAAEDGDAPSTSARTTSDSVFEVEDDAAATEGTGKTAEASAGTPAEEERAPIALGPPSRETDDQATTEHEPASATDGDAAVTTDREPAAANGEAAAAANGEATAATDGEPGTSGAGEPEAGDDHETHETSVFEPARPTDADPVANGTEPVLPESGTGAPVVATEEPPVVLPDEGAAPIAVVSAAAVTEVATDGRPEGAPGTVEEPASLLGAIDPDDTRARFLDIQAGFVDEPRQAVHEAERFVDDLVQQLVRALETERASLKATIENGSTEDLRVALRGYRVFVDRLLNLR